ncbi:MAG: dTDP-4-dehydrorhamnose 3,5-epimerase family protein [Spirochaetales bacterium]|nr:dTDP-4-dehydrorhamnose 3,5-epimerase family protein [Spirochaetales bacterium]
MDFKKGNIQGVIIQRLVKFVDDRGYLVETFRKDTLPENLMPQMSYISFTEPGVTRGPHEHVEQTDIFTFLGPGNFKVVLWDNRKDSPDNGNRMVLFAGKDNPVTLIVPPGIVHAYRNVSRGESGMVVNYPNCLFAGKDKKEKVDEIRHEEEKDLFYKDFKKL